MVRFLDSVAIERRCIPVRFQARRSNLARCSRSSHPADPGAASLLVPHAILKTDHWDDFSAA